MALSLPLWTLPSHDSPDMDRSKGKAMVLLSTPLCFLLVTASVSLLLFLCPFNVNQVADVSRNPRDLQHHLGAIEAVLHGVSICWLFYHSAMHMGFIGPPTTRHINQDNQYPFIVYVLLFLSLIDVLSQRIYLNQVFSISFWAW